MNKDYYIGVRSDFNTMGKLLDRPMLRLNTGMANHLRTTAMRKGIKKTEQRQRLEFFIVSKEEMDNLLDDSWRAMQKLATAAECRPLVKVKADVFSDAIDKVNSKPEYQGGMDYDTHNKYKEDLAKSFDKALEVVGTDLNIRKTKPKLPDNPFKVGDLIPFKNHKQLFRHEFDYGQDTSDYIYANKRIAKAGKKFVEIECLKVKHVENGEWYNSDSAVKHFNDVRAYGLTDEDGYAGWQNGHAIPLESNPDALEWVLVRDYNGKPKKFQWTKFASYDFSNGKFDDIKYKDADYYADLEPAYCYAWESRD